MKVNRKVWLWAEKHPKEVEAARAAFDSKRMNATDPADESGDQSDAKYRH